MSVRRLGRATGSRAPSKWIRLGEVLRPGLQARLHVYSRLRGPISQLASRFREPSDDGQNQFHLVPLFGRPTLPWYPLTSESDPSARQHREAPQLHSFSELAFAFPIAANRRFPTQARVCRG